MLVLLSCRNAGFRNTAVMDSAPGSSPGLADKIQGIWGISGEETASFVIREDKIIYPEIDAGYRYSLKNDSIKIKYDEDERVFALHIQGPDTLILTGNEKQVYYRYKE